VRPPRPLELVAIASLSISVLAVAVPVFVRNLHASRLTEPLDALKHIAERASALAAERDVARAYPPPAPLTPREVSAGKSVRDPAEDWSHPTWRELDFRMDHAHYFSFAFDSKNGKLRSSFTATAHGDLDGDGVLSTFQLSGEVEASQQPVLFPPEIQREVE
jgi:hypothetical protein